MPGSVGILNVGAGDTKLTFDPKDPAEAKRSAAIVRDMIRKGFVLLIEVGTNEKGPIYQRARDFDPETHEYIIAGTAQQENDNDEKPASPPKGRRAGKRTSQPRRVPASSTNAVAVARTAGG